MFRSIVNHVIDLEARLFGAFSYFESLLPNIFFYFSEGKRKFALDPNQRKLSDMFKVVKKSGGKSGSAVTAEPDVAAAEMPLNPP